MKVNTYILVRITLSGLFVLALVSKLTNPSALMDPLRTGLRLQALAAAAVFLLAFAALAACIGTLSLRRGPLGLVPVRRLFHHPSGIRRCPQPPRLDRLLRLRRRPAHGFRKPADDPRVPEHGVCCVISIPWIPGTPRGSIA